MTWNASSATFWIQDTKGLKQKSKILHKKASCVAENVSQTEMCLHSGCPACGDERKGYTSHPPLAAARPDLAAEWAWERNGSKTPEKVTLGRVLKAWWVCSADPEHPPWQAMVQNRALRGTGCPTCFRAKLSQAPRQVEADQS